MTANLDLFPVYEDYQACLRVKIQELLQAWGAVKVAHGVEQMSIMCFDTSNELSLRVEERTLLQMEYKWWAFGSQF